MTDRLELLGGVYYDHEANPQTQVLLAADPLTGVAVAEARRVNYPADFKEYAVFGTLTYHFTDKFDVQIGGRKSDVKYVRHMIARTGPFYTPSIFEPELQNESKPFTYLLTARYKPTDDLMIYARLASGFRPGSPNTAAAQGVGAPPATTPDKTKNYEVGLKQSLFGGDVNIEASLYYIDWSDIQISLISQAVGYNDNGGSAKSAGAEFSVTARLAEGLRFEGWAAYSDAVLTEPFPANSSARAADGARLPFSSRWSAHGSLDYDFTINSTLNGFVGAGASYTGERFGLFTATGAQQKYPSFLLADLKAGVRAEGWEAMVYINNVADKRAALSGGIGYFFPDYFIYAQPRTIGVNINHKF